jgi:hypothetical protein
MSKAPIEKLPLAARKDSMAFDFVGVSLIVLVRDSWEAHRDSLSSKVSSLLGETYTLDVNMNAIYPYADESSYAKNSPGQMTKSYFDSFIYHLESYVKKYGDDGKATFNNTVSAKKITFEVDDTGKFSYCGCDIKDGRFRILAKDNYLGTNINDACYEMVKAVEAAEAATGAGGLSVGAKANVKETVDKDFPALENEFAEILGDKVTLDSNLDANNTKLRAKSGGYNDSQLGTVTLDYFRRFADQLIYLKFKGDEMMQEGFMEACDKKIIRLEVVDSLKYNTYNDIIFEEGVCKLQVCFPCDVVDGRLPRITGGRMLVTLEDQS